MSLTEALTKQLEEIKSKIPSEKLALMEQATADLARSGILDRSLKAGDRVEDFSLPNALGKTIAIGPILAGGPVVIAFYRGGWCPYCNLELRALQQALPEMKALGAELVTISPQTPDNSLSTAEKNELTFEVLSDVGNHVARKFGLVFQVPEELRPIYASFGIDLPAHNGDDTFELPIAATYVIASDGTIVHAFVDADYTKRQDPAEILEILQTMKVAA